MMRLAATKAFGVNILFGLLFVWSSAAKQVDANPSGPISSQVPHNTQIDALFAQWDNPASPGCAIAVIKNSEVQYERGYGTADLDHDVPITPRTVFHVASISKQFTATALLMLVREGKLRLDDPVRKYVPEVPDFGTPITLRELAHHTSGLRDQWEILHLAGWRNSLDLITDQDVLDVLSRQKHLNFQPGSEFLYSNTGFTLLAQVVQRVSGQSFSEFTTSKIFEPLSMLHTHFRDDHAEIVKGMAYGYEPHGAAFDLSEPNFDTVGATSLLTTVEDLARWDQVFYQPRLLGDPDLVSELLERGVLNSGKKIDYAFGLVIGAYRGLPTVDHAGADAGYRADLLRFPVQHLSIVVLCNVSNATPSRLARRIADLYLPQDLPSSSLSDRTLTAVAPLPANRLRALVGTFVNAERTSVLRIFVRDKELRAGFEIGEGFQLIPLNDDTFRRAGSSSTFRFSRGASEGPLRITLSMDGEGPQVFARVPEYKPSANNLGNYAGIYRSDEADRILRLAAGDGRLEVITLKSTERTMQPVSLDLYQWGPFCVSFLRGSSGRVEALSVKSDRTRDFRFVRID